MNVILKDITFKAKKGEVSYISNSRLNEITIYAEKYAFKTFILLTEIFS